MKTVLVGMNRHVITGRTISVRLGIILTVRMTGADMNIGTLIVKEESREELDEVLGDSRYFRVGRRWL